MTEQDLLREAIEKIWEAGTKDTGLDPFPIHFEIVPATVMYEVGAYGLPGRFSHWSHGKAFHQMKTMYDYGLSKIYELIINTDPAQAYLMEGNSLIQNKLVIAHVIGHSDFFKKNVYFRHTDRQMAEKAMVTAERIRAYEFEHGEKVIEEFLDVCLAVQEHIDPNLHTIRAQEGDERRDPNKRRVTEYDDLWNLMDKPQDPEEKQKRIPVESEKDLLLFLLQYAPDLEDWQRDILNIIRNEMIYFLPQMQTKIMNEGWASYHHSQILRSMEFTGEEHLEFTRLHSGVLSPSPRGTSINPYYLGMKIFEDIERRWNGDLTEEERRDYQETHHGRDWPHVGEGRAKIFEVRELENDVSFLRNYLTKKLVDEMDMYVYEREGDEWVVVEKNWQVIRDRIVESMTNFGYPYLTVENGDYRRSRDLYLKHHHDGRDLDHDYALHTMSYLHQIWKRPIHLETLVGGRTYYDPDTGMPKFSPAVRTLWTYRGKDDMSTREMRENEDAFNWE